MDSRRLVHSLSSCLTFPSSSVHLLTSCPLWFPWHSVAEYKVRFRNTTVCRLSTGLRHYSVTRRSSAGIECGVSLLKDQCGESATLGTLPRGYLSAGFVGTERSFQFHRFLA